MSGISRVCGAQAVEVATRTHEIPFCRLGVGWQKKAQHPKGKLAVEVILEDKAVRDNFANLSEAQSI